MSSGSDQNTRLPKQLHADKYLRGRHYTQDEVVSAEVNKWRLVEGPVKLKWSYERDASNNPCVVTATATSNTMSGAGFYRYETRELGIRCNIQYTPVNPTEIFPGCKVSTIDTVENTAFSEGNIASQQNTHIRCKSQVFITSIRADSSIRSDAFMTDIVSTTEPDGTSWMRFQPIRQKHPQLEDMTGKMYTDLKDVAGKWHGVQRVGPGTRHESGTGRPANISMGIRTACIQLDGREGYQGDEEEIPKIASLPKDWKHYQTTTEDKTNGEVYEVRGIWLGMEPSEEAIVTPKRGYMSFLSRKIENASTVRKYEPSHVPEDEWEEASVKDRWSDLGRASRLNE